MAGWQANESVLPQACLSVVVCRRLSSVTFVHCGQTAIDRLMISSLSDRENTWLRQALNSIKIGIAVFEQWRLQWGYPPFRVDRDRLIGHIFGSIARRKHRTAKIMAPYYRQLSIGNPMAHYPCYKWRPSVTTRIDVKLQYLLTAILKECFEHRQPSITSVTTKINAKFQL